MTLGPRPIGILSGLGPLAGSDVLGKLLEHAAARYGAVEDCEYPDVVLVSHGIPDFDMTGPVSIPFRDQLIRVVEDLERHQPALLGIACNTAHLYLDALREHTTARVIDLIAAVADEAAAQPRRYLLLSSSTTRSTGLYRRALEAHGVRFSEVDDSTQAEVDQVVHLVMGNHLSDAAARITRIVTRCSEPFDAIIAGCTELPLALDHSRLRRLYPVIDSNRVLAHRLADAWYGSRRSTARPVTRVAA